MSVLGFRFFFTVVFFEVFFFWVGVNLRLVSGCVFLLPFVLMVSARVLCASFSFVPFLFRGISYCFSVLCDLLVY